MLAQLNASDILNGPALSLGLRSLTRSGRKVTNEEIKLPQAAAEEDEEKQRLEEKVSLLENQINELQTKDEMEILDQDTFSIMMTSKLCSSGWAFGLITFSSQIALITLILYDFFESGSIPIPVKVPATVTAGQFFAVVLSVLAQSDNFTAINALIVFWEPHRWHDVFVDEGETGDYISRFKWLRRIFLPNFLKIIQGCAVLLTSFIIIVTSTDLVDLLKDFTALYFVSEIDNILFTVAAQGFLGHSLKERTIRVTSVKVCEDSDSSTITCFTFDISPKFAMILILLFGTSGCWGYFVQGQRSGSFLKKKHYDCSNSIEFVKLGELDYRKSNYTEEDDESKSDYASHFNNGRCDGWMNTFECDYDGEDCASFNLQYPSCHVPDTNIVGDGFCNGGIYNTIACGNDGGDCDNCPPAIKSDVMTYSLSSADVNGDGLTDIIIGNSNTGNQILFNKGGGELVAKPLNGTSQRNTFSSSSQGSIIVFGNGGEECREVNQIIRIIEVDDLFNVSFDSQDLPGGETNTTSINLVSLFSSGDDPDIVVGNYGQPNQILLWNSTTKHFTPKNLIGNNLNNAIFDAIDAEKLIGDDIDTSTTTNTLTTDIKVVDINNDGFLDIVVANYEQSNQVLINKGNNQTFRNQILPGGDNTKTKSISIVEIGNKKHIVVGNYGEPNQLIWDNGNGVFNEKEIYELPSNGKLRTSNVRVYDMNTDTFPDLLITNRGESNQVLLHSRSEHEYFYPTAIDLPCSDELLTSDIISADMDGDGFQDIIVGNEDFQNNMYSNFLGDGLTYIPPQGNRTRAGLPE